MTRVHLPKQIFVTGTGTDVGKTVLAGALCLGLDAHYWKPVQAGHPTDSGTIASWIGPSRVFPEGVILDHPRSPNQAAMLEERYIDHTQLVLPAHDGRLVVEGAGGLMVPINERFMMIDLIDQLHLPVVLAANSGLGTLNHTLLSIAALRLRSIPILGVVLIGPPHKDNARDIVQFGHAPILGQLDLLPDLTPASLTRAFLGFSIQK